MRFIYACLMALAQPCALWAANTLPVATPPSQDPLTREVRYLQIANPDNGIKAVARTQTGNITQLRPSEPANNSLSRKSRAMNLKRKLIPDDAGSKRRPAAKSGAPAAERTPAL